MVSLFLIVIAELGDLVPHIISLFYATDQKKANNSTSVNNHLASEIIILISMLSLQNQSVIITSSQLAVHAQ